MTAAAGRVVSTGACHPLIEEVLAEFRPIVMTPDHAPAKLNRESLSPESFALPSLLGGIL